jgi:hypothetical protein
MALCNSSTANRFYLTLPSNVSGYGDHENITSHFKTQLIRPLVLDPPNIYEVALVEIFFPFTWYNITKDIGECVFSLVPDDQPESVIEGVIKQLPPRLLKEGHYTEPESLLAEIWRHKPNHITGARYHYNKASRKVEITLEKWEVLKMHRTLARILGFEKRIIGPVIRTGKNRRTFVADHPVCLKTHFHMFVYTDFIQPNLVGDTEAPLLAVIPLDQGKEWGETSFQPILNPQYCPINKSCISEIGVKLMSGLGEFIKFQSGQSMLKLHIRKRAPHLIQ